MINKFKVGQQLLQGEAEFLCIDLLADKQKILDRILKKGSTNPH